MARMMFLGILVAILAGCASTKSTTSLSPSDKAQVREGQKVYTDCLYKELLSMDDHVTPPETIADAVMTRCSKERGEFSAKLASLGLEPSDSETYIEGMRRYVRNDFIVMMLKQRAAKQN